MGRVRVLVVDDHRIFAEALAATLAAEPDVEVGVAGSAAGAERALERAAAEGRPFDVVLVDADLGAAARRPGRPVEAEAPPGRAPAPRRPSGPLTAVPPPRPVGPAPDGLLLLARACRSHPELRAVVLATEDDPRRAVRALQSGAGGWVAKDSSLPRLMAVIRGVLRGETHLPPTLLTGVVRELTAARRDRTESERLVETLTPREEEVLRCMVAGLGRQAVAERLYLSPHTVRTHMQNVLGKLGVHSTLAAVAVARRAGVSPSEPSGPPQHPTPTTPTVASTAGPGAG
ncbi:LuxR C-terminal-related transcriptional regulator [Kitasatospora sp. NPDC096147]|uniref:LuxR C-terminal-related transcriptional regulator n=1 Tax=Kitasatospora sp. NPDC096147 TaxID=3364093 RepID=UPI003808B2DE